MSFLISGIQQVGIGVSKVHDAFNWYNRHFGMDIPVFEEAAEANLMLPYTAGMPHSRHAILAININGGGGFEIWQYTSRTPQSPAFQPRLGDLGLFCAKIKSRNIEASFQQLGKSEAKVLGTITLSPAGKKHFFIQDPYGNYFEIIEDDNWFGSSKASTGGPCGMIIGVSDMDRSLKFYSQVLGYDQIIHRSFQVQNDLSGIYAGTSKIERCIITHKEDRMGPFSKLLGRSYIELVKVEGYQGRKIFENRLWGDLGFIHLCFDIRNMRALQLHCEKHGHPFTVDGGEGFDMGEASGHFTYIEDPDGTLIEFVETKKVPILKKLNWYLDLRKRDPAKRLPDWMLKALALNRKKV